MIPAARHRAEVATSPIREAALRLASEGVPVLPVAGKRPVGRLAPHGVHSATTDPDTIGAWWDEEPGAGVAMRTGLPGGIVGLDLDILDAVERAERLGWPRQTSWPETALVQTRQGYHLLLRTDEALPTFDPFPGATFKAEGGYLLAPPSPHPRGGRYRAVGGELVPVFGWLMEMLAEREHVEPSATTTIVTPDLDGPPILEGGRNWGLFRAACSLRARGAGREQIVAHLHGLNAARCTPPLDPAEVEKVARSASRYAPGTAARQVTQEVHDFLDRYEALVLAHPWRGSGLTDHDTLLAIGEFARRFGTMIESGVRVEVASRDAAPVAGCSLRTFHRSVKRVKPTGFLTQDNEERQPDEAGAFVLRVPRAYCHHPTSGGVETGGTGGVNLRVPAMRWDGMSKKKGRVLRALVWLNGAATVIELAEAIHDPRPWALRRRHIRPMAEAGIVAFDPDTDVVTITERSEQALTDERALRGEIMAERRDRILYERQREAYREARGR